MVHGVEPSHRVKDEATAPHQGSCKPSPQYPHRPLVQALGDIVARGTHRFHVPGHGGMVESAYGAAMNPALVAAASLDWSEVDGLDDLANPQGPIAEAEHAMAELVGAAHTLFSVNGSSAGLMAAMAAVFSPGDSVIVPRNAHRSILSALIWLDLTPIWLWPEYDAEWGWWSPVTAESFAAFLAENPWVREKAAGLVVVHPTYEGVAGDLPNLMAETRRLGLKVVMDEAHGSLWPLSEHLPDSALALPQDLAAEAVVQSFHKHGGSLTQSAVVHISQGSSLSPRRLRQCLNGFQSTSPSFLLLASLDEARAYWDSPAGQAHLGHHLDEVARIRQAIVTTCPALEFWNPSGRWFQCSWDPSRLVIRVKPSVANISAKAWADALYERFGLECEEVNGQSAVYFATVGLISSDYEALLKGFQALNDELVENQGESWGLQAQEEMVGPWEGCLKAPRAGMTPRQAFFAPSESVESFLAVGRVIQEVVVQCPPGIPVLMPGEEIEAHHVPHLPQQVEVISSAS